MCDIHNHHISVLLRGLGMARSLLMKAIPRKKVYHIIALSLLLISILFSIFRFAPVANRIWQGIKDFGLSLAYYATKTLNNVGLLKASQVTKATVNVIPDGLEEVLPFEWDVFCELFEIFLHRCVDISYFKEYLVLTADKLAEISADLLLLLLPGVSLIGINIGVFDVFGIKNAKEGRLGF